MCPTAEDAHRALVVDDDPATVEMLVAYVTSLGHTSLVAMNLEEIERAIAAGGYCYVLLDKQLPAKPGGVPLASTGDTGLKALRKRDPRRREGTDDYHVTPILVVTSSASDPKFVVKNLHLGASDFIPKPFSEETLTEAILAALHRAGRDDHATCGHLGASSCVSPSAATAALVAAPATNDVAAVGAPLVRLFIDGTPVKQRTSLLVNGTRCALRNSYFLPLLKLAAIRVRQPEALISAHELGVLRAPEIPSRIHEELAGAVPEGFLIIQHGESRMLRLHPLVVVDHIDWAVLERSSDPGIQKLAAAERKRR